MAHGRRCLLLLGVIFVGLCRSESPVRPRPPQPECKNIVNCLVDPCQVNKCPANPDAKCIANYCGGCNAIFLDASGNKITDCSSRDKDGRRCRGGQVLKKCGSCVPARTCEEPDKKKDVVCPEVCEPKCECPDSQPIWRNGRCITEAECSTPPRECKSNLVWNDCGSSCSRPWRICSDTKNNKAFSIADRSKTDGKVCAAVCKPRCECPEKAPVLYNGMCVPESSCPKEPEKCRSWQVHCPINPCEQQTCPSKPDAGCRPYYCGGCLANFFNEVDAPVKDCTHSLETCSGGQEWNRCGSACLATCSDPRPKCIKMCVPRCQCPSDKPIWKDGQCVTMEECDSSQCKGNMVFEKCGSACTRTCKDKNPVCTEQCVPKCQCPKDLPILYKGVCIAEEKCPEKPVPECKGGMVYDSCASKCTATCALQEPECAYECIKGCTCPKDAPILHKGECIPANECPKMPECEGGQVWRTCGMNCTLTCDQPRPICSRECVEKCQCPPFKPFLHEGQCIPFDRCPRDPPKPKEECVYKRKEYAVGESWKPDPCTDCTCELNPETKEKMEICSVMDCARPPKCETELITPRGQCCPICAEACNYGSGTYEIGKKWTPDPCTTCVCVERPDGKKEEKCYKIYCDIPKCDTELVWDKKSCCPYCAEECTNKGREYEVGDSWKPNDCTSCQCVEENGKKKQICARQKCMPPGPNCRPYRKPGECCPRCDETCTMYDKKTDSKTKYEVGQTWKPDACTKCTCEKNPATGGVQEFCKSKDCDRNLRCSSYEERVFKRGMCCPMCLKACYEVRTSDGELILHKPNEPWQRTPCETCYCVPDDDTVYKNVCNEIMCDIPVCGPFSEIIYDKEKCCPYCSEPCTFKGKSYDIGDSWKPDVCTKCDCVEDGGKKRSVCQVQACERPEKPCKLVYSKDSCCPKCQSQCEAYDGGVTTVYQAGDSWKPNACTFCNCELNANGEKEQICAMLDCAPLEEKCIPVFKDGECCPVCDDQENKAFDDDTDICNVQPSMENGRAVDKSGSGQDLVYTFECDDGYWLKEGSGNTAYCNKKGEAVYPVCEKLSISTRLAERAPGTYLLEISSTNADGARSRWGLLCDDGWSDREAQLVCKKHGYNFGRAVSLESDVEDFLFTQMSCPRDDDFLLQECSVTRYADAKLPCQFNEAAGLFCYNAAFEYRITDKIQSKWSKRTISLIFDVSALKYGKPLNLKRGIFRLDPSDFTVTSDKSTSNATKARIKFRDGVATVRMKLKRPSNFMSVNCITLSIKGPTKEFDHHVKEICANFN